jgi:hypothetical protein
MTAPALHETGAVVRRYGPPGNLWEGYYSVELAGDFLGFVRYVSAGNAPGWSWMRRHAAAHGYGFKLRRDAVGELVAAADHSRSCRGSHAAECSCGVA